ncbi:MAG: ribosome-binding factor A [Candidatus Saganbacteria bacterium]|uniref:Ribosome-binding factor A n=1 Tax=Candidatus Saganbacteria bacterium TaxID=2575572 RepID=A0A833L1D5_UNCSA|nr:MAG: ribosome-binding factor A [Candidatus Saganbacteria bacterium]
MTRPERVAELIKKEISRILHERVSDPRIGFASVTQVKMSPDLQNANIFISVLGTKEEREKTFEGLKSAASFIRGQLGNAIEFRSVPRISFVYDKSIEKASKVFAIMNKLEREAAEGNKLSNQKKKK